MDELRGLSFRHKKWHAFEAHEVCNSMVHLDSYVLLCMAEPKGLLKGG